MCRHQHHGYLNRGATASYSGHRDRWIGIVDDLTGASYWMIGDPPGVKMLPTATPVLRGQSLVPGRQNRGTRRLWLGH
jgi:hypothetical protein